MYDKNRYHAYKHLIRLRVYFDLFLFLTVSKNTDKLSIKRNYCFLSSRKTLKDYKVISKSDELWKIPLDTPTFSF